MPTRCAAGRNAGPAMVPATRRPDILAQRQSEREPRTPRHRRTDPAKNARASTRTSRPRAAARWQRSAAAGALECFIDLRRRPVAVQPARAMVELCGDRIELLLAQTTEILALGQVLAQQPVGVLIAAALPRAVLMAQVDRHASRSGNGLVLGHLPAAIPRQGAPQRRRDAKQAAS